MEKEAITLLGVGDIMIDREGPESIFLHVAEVLRSADIAYANCEQALSNLGTPHPLQAAYSSPANLQALLHAGFDIVSLANNHSSDWGKEALLDTIVRLNDAGLPPVGAGRNLSEARQPVILERKGTRVGFLAYSTVHRDGYEATDTTPGVTPIRVWTFYDKQDYQPATIPRIISMPHREDLTAMVEDIRQLKAQVDVVVLCMHWGLHLVPAVIPMYCKEIGHAAVDAGADLIIGTHDHLIKAIESYRGKAIFYNTGNFAMEFGPHMRDHQHIEDLSELYGIEDHSEERHSLVAKAVIEDGEIKRVSYIPCYINERSEPEIVKRSDPRGQDVFEYMKSVSRKERIATHFEWDGDEVLIVS